jgi:hypothetical protein
MRLKRLRTTILLFVLLTVAAIFTLWLLPGTRYTLTGQGIQTRNGYLLWVAEVRGAWLRSGVLVRSGPGAPGRPSFSEEDTREPAR